MNWTAVIVAALAAIGSGGVAAAVLRFIEDRPHTVIGSVREALEIKQRQFEELEADLTRLQEEYAQVRARSERIIAGLYVRLHEALIRVHQLEVRLGIEAEAPIPPASFPSPDDPTIPYPEEEE